MPARIMIVEDEKDVALIVKAILEKLGYEAECLMTHGEGALEKIEKHRPDLILMDIMLRSGETGGIDIAKEINQKLHIPVIFLTGLDDDKCFEMARSADPFGFILKPFRYLELRAAVEMGLQKAHAEAELRKYRDHLEELVAERTAALGEANRKLLDEIAERKAAEEEIRKSERRYRALAEAAEDAIFIIDKEDRIDYVNSSAARLIGCAPEALTGQPRVRLFPDEAAGGQKGALEEVFSTGRPYRSDSCIKYPEREIWMDHCLVPLKDDNNQVYAVMGISRDITDRREAGRILETSLNEKEILLKEIHHRVKGNMQAISSLLNLQAGQFKDPQLRTAFELIRNRIRSMALIHEKLYTSGDIAYIEFGAHTRSIVNHLVMAYRGEDTHVELDVDEMKIELEKAIPLSLILNELLSNALIHGLPEGGNGIIRVSLHMAGEGDVMLMIGDNGRGLPEDMDINDASTLGLTLVSALLKQIDGTIESKREKGTELTIRFKVKE